MKKWVIAFIIASIAAASLSIPVHLLRMEYNHQFYMEQRSHARDHLTLIREDLQSELDNSLFYADFIEMVIRQNPEITSYELREYARFIVERNELIENITVAEDGVISFIYPSAVNRAAIGLNLFDDEENLNALQNAVSERTSNVQGPVEAVQGGNKIFNRKPVFIESMGRDVLWGFSSVTVDFDQLVQTTLAANENPNYLFGIKTESGNDGSVIWGDEDLLQSDNVKLNLSLPDNNWSLIIAPVDGWAVKNAFNHLELVVSYILLSIIFILVYVFVILYISKRDQSRRDVLTGLLNKHTFEDSAKKVLKYSTQKNGIILLDFNEFKKTNDDYGHLAGDRVLKVSAKRMKESVKQSDFVGRIGGDEFMILLRDVQNEENLQRIAERIVSHVEQPVLLNDNLISHSLSYGFMMTTNMGVFDNLYDLVDKKMYNHKNHHKDSAFFTLKS